MATAQTSPAWVKPDPMSNPRSIERQFRTRRFRHVRRLMEAALQEREEIEVLDLGGTESYWAIAEDVFAEHRDRITITLVNNEPSDPPKNPVFRAVSGELRPRSAIMKQTAAIRYAKPVAVALMIPTP